MMEVFAGFTAHTDHEVGRLIASLETLGARDNTLVIYVVGDNGASAEGGLEGSTNALRAFNGVPDDLATNLAAIDGLGGPMYANHFPAGWAWAMNTPFQWTKQVASHFGGVRNPMVISWPGRVERGGLRGQFHHVVDLMPTILEAANLRLPIAIDGIQQRPLDGISMAYTFGAEGAQAEGRRRTQAFEMFINRGIYHDGWMASSRWRTPWDPTPRAGSVDDATWELYHVEQDFSQARDLAAAEPQRLRAMQDLWWAEAARNQILPLDNRTIERFDPAQRPNIAGDRTSFTFYPGLVQLQTGAAPSILNRSFAVTAEIEVPRGGGNGMLMTHGGRQAGYGLFLDAGRPTFVYNFLGIERFVITAEAPLAQGRHVLRAEFTREGNRPGSGGTLTLFAGDRRIGQGTIARTMPARMQIDEGLDIGLDDGTPLTEAYADRMPFRFDGQITRVTIDLR
jgi:arylsulfatase